MLDALLGLVEQELDLDTSRPAPDLRRLGEQVQRLVAVHISLAEAALGRRRQPEPEAITAPMIRAIRKARRLRGRHLGPDIADAAWALILAAYEARLDSQSLPLTRIGQAADVRQSTAYYWVRRLCERGLLTRNRHPQDRRIVLIGLNNKAAERVETYLKAAMRLSPKSFDASLS
ncbi:MAG TPA: MarR family transcriptional regulator [Allosphingosinicella sp.]|nr:MarR family transcriptional regulator [Allosphingosinicella sp.]